MWENQWDRDRMRSEVPKYIHVCTATRAGKRGGFYGSSLLRRRRGLRYLGNLLSTLGTYLPT